MHSVGFVPPSGPRAASCDSPRTPLRRGSSLEDFDRRLAVHMGQIPAVPLVRPLEGFERRLASVEKKMLDDFEPRLVDVEINRAVEAFLLAGNDGKADGEAVPSQQKLHMCERAEPIDHGKHGVVPPHLMGGWEDVKREVKEEIKAEMTAIWNASAQSVNARVDELHALVMCVSGTEQALQRNVETINGFAKVAGNDGKVDGEAVPSQQKWHMCELAQPIDHGKHGLSRTEQAELLDASLRNFEIMNAFAKGSKEIEQCQVDYNCVIQTQLIHKFRSDLQRLSLVRGMLNDCKSDIQNLSPAKSSMQECKSDMQKSTLSEEVLHRVGGNCGLANDGDTPEIGAKLRDDLDGGYFPLNAAWQHGNCDSEFFEASSTVVEDLTLASNWLRTVLATYELADAESFYEEGLEQRPEYRPLSAEL